MARLKGFAVVAALGVLMFVGGCSQAGARDGAGAPQTASSETTGVVYAKVIDSTEGTAPALTYREYKVPGWGSLDGYGERLAMISYSPQEQGEPTRLQVLDFKTGKSREIVSECVGFKDGFDILGVWSTDEWVAWEELKGNEQEARYEVQWKLYVAKLDAETLTCGKPVLVDESEVSMHSRPLFRFDGDVLYWMTNSTPNPRQEGTVHGAIVKARDLNTGNVRTIRETGKHYATMSVGDGKVIVAEMGTESYRTTIRVIDPATSQDTWSLDLMNEDMVTHFPQVHDGSIAWTAYTHDTISYPDLHYRGEDGVTHFVRKGTQNPMHVGKYLFFGGIHIVSRGINMKRNLNIIGGYDPATNKTFTVIDGEDDVSWRMQMGVGYREDSFVVSADLAPDAPDPEAAAKAPMLIRKYTLSES